MRQVFPETFIGSLIEAPVGGYWGLDQPTISSPIEARVIRNGDVEKDGSLFLMDLPPRSFSPDEVVKAEFADHDLVLVSSGAYTGNVGRFSGGPVGQRVVVSNFVRRIRPLRGINSSWLFHLMRSSLVQGRIPAYMAGSAIPNLSSDWTSIKAPTPSGEEQARIAEVLDTLDEAIRGTEAIVEKLLAAKQGLLMDTFEANVRSTAEPLGYYLQGIDAGKSPDCPEKPAQAGEWGVLKVSAVVRSGFRPNENKAVLNPVYFNSAYEVRPGDLLITRANTYDLIAQACVVREAPPRLMLCDKTLRLKLNQKASAEFLSIALTTPTARRHIEINATGSSGTMKNITQGAIRAIPVPNLDRARQDQLTGQMAALVARIDAETEQMNKLKSLKSGLSADLLTGRVRVTTGAPA